MRSQRKDEHIRTYLQEQFHGDPLFSDVVLFHHALPEMSLDQVDTSVLWEGKPLAMPFYINAITGGTPHGQEINEALARVAAKCDIPMAVGSMRIALEDPRTATTFRIVRQHHRHGVIWANIGANATAKEALKAVELLEADGLQIHINAGQELMMAEGDRDFTTWLQSIASLTAALPVPVIVKEVGSGLDPASIQSLYDVGVRHVDVSGYGGTNFMQIERSRAQDGYDFSSLEDWGNPTAWCLAKARELNLPDLHVYGSGGIYSALDALKAFALGAELVGISGPLLYHYIHFGEKAVADWLKSLHEGLRRSMVLSGAENLKALRNLPLRYTGRLKDIL